MRRSAAFGSCSKTLRYFAIATALVVAVLAALTSVRLARDAAGASHYTPGRATPGAPERERPATSDAGAASGDAPWALSALPECFAQLRSARGSPAFAGAKIPPDARVVPSGSVVRAADCTLAVLPAEIRVSRGADRLRIPPRARLLLAGRGDLVLDRRDGPREEVRVYRVAGSAPLITPPLPAAVP